MMPPQEVPKCSEFLACHHLYDLGIQRILTRKDYYEG